VSCNSDKITISSTCNNTTSRTSASYRANFKMQGGGCELVGPPPTPAGAVAYTDARTVCCRRN
jgi:hypothetical protein